MTAPAPGASRKRKLLILALSVLLLLVLGWIVHQYVSLEELVARETSVRQYIALNPLSAFFYGFGVYMMLALVPGTGGKAIVWGWLFGFWQAVLIVTVGLSIAAMIIFELSRYLFREAVERRYVRFLAIMNRHLKKEGAFYLLTLRMAHAPFSIVNPVSGASRVRTWTFFWTTVIGLLPANVIWAYVGLRLPSLAELAEHGPGTFIDLPLIAALVFCAMLPALVRWGISHFGIPATPGEHDATIHEPQKTRQMRKGKP